MVPREVILTDYYAHLVTNVQGVLWEKVGAVLQTIFCEPATDVSAAFLNIKSGETAWDTALSTIVPAEKNPPRMLLVFVEFFENLLYFDSDPGGNFLCASLRFEMDNQESGVTQPDEVWLCEGAELFFENLAAKDDLMWRAKDEKADAPPRQWMSELLEQRKGMVGQSGAGKLSAYVMASCCRPCCGDSCSSSSTCQRAKSWNNAWDSSTTKKAPQSCRVQ